MKRNIPEGTVLDGKYRIIRMLGEGGFGEVYLAEDNLLKGHHVAIKSLKMNDSNREQILVREMQFLSKLDHPNVVHFYHHFSEYDTLFLVMEFCGGGSMREPLQDQIQFENEKVVSWAIDLCKTLQVVHKKGIVHHDLKPDNILFSDDDILKIGDFGIANARAGTIPYMAPELFLLGERVSRSDARVDIYALGVTFLEVLTGANPFCELSEEAALHSKISLNFIPESLQSWLREIILKALHPKPELRFQTMHEFQEALESRHVPYVFKQKRIQAHEIASKAEWNLRRKKWARAIKLAEQAERQDPDCVSALITAGKCELLLRRSKKATGYFERAIRINPRVNIQKELGWIYLEEGRFPEAISMLNDYLQRNAADYEAYNLLLKAFYLTGRYDAAADLSRVIQKDYKDNGCFRNNLLLCEVVLERMGKEDVTDIATKNPFIEYNRTVILEQPSSWDESEGVPLKSKLLFQEFRFGDLKKCRPNVLVIEDKEGAQTKFNQPIVTIGRLNDNDIVFQNQSVSRRHCLIVNYANDVWLYDMGSTYGTSCDGIPIKTAVFLDGRHKIKIADTTFTVLAKEGILL